MAVTPKDFVDRYGEAINNLAPEITKEIIEHFLNDPSSVEDVPEEHQLFLKMTVLGTVGQMLTQAMLQGLAQMGGTSSITLDALDDDDEEEKEECRKLMMN